MCASNYEKLASFGAYYQTGIPIASMLQAISAKSSRVIFGSYPQRYLYVNLLYHFLNFPFFLKLFSNVQNLKILQYFEAFNSKKSAQNKPRFLGDTYLGSLGSCMYFTSPLSNFIFKCLC